MTIDIDLPSSSGCRSTVPWSLTCSANRISRSRPDVGVAHLAAPELDRDLDPVAVLQELDGAADLGVEVALADLRLEPDLLELDRPLVAAGFLLAAGLLVLELAVVEQTRDRRSGHGGDLDEVDAPLLRESESLTGGHDAQLAPVFVHDPHLRDADHLVDAQVSTQARSSSVRTPWRRARRYVDRGPPSPAGL